MFIAVMVALGAVGGFLSGLLGIGGAIIIIPLLLYVPELLGLESIGMQEVAGLSMVNVFAASISAVIAHAKYKNVSKKLVRFMGISMLAGTFTGAAMSVFVPDLTLLFVYVSLATFSFVMLVFDPEKVGVKNAYTIGEVEFNRTLAAVISINIGFMVGLIGAGGGFVIIPAMVYILKIPFKIAIGSALGIVLISSIGGLTGKLIASHVPLIPALALIIGSVPAANLGCIVNKKCSARTLRILLASLTGIIGAFVWFDIFNILL